MIEIIDCVQGTHEWYQARLGIPTASAFHKILAKGEGKTRARYMRDLAGEILTGIPSESFTSSAMERGKLMEDEAREQYARTRFVDLTRVGFVKNTNLIPGVTIGASPDALIAEDGGLEIKTMMPALLIELIEKGPPEIPSAHYAQVQGNLWVCEREYWDLKIYYSGMPDYTVRVGRDESYIGTLRDEIERFAYETRKIVERMRMMMGQS